MRQVTLWPWPLTAVISGGSRHVVNPSTSFEDHTPIRSWLMSYDVPHRPTLIMRLEPPRTRRITWPVRWGQIFPHVFEIPDPDSKDWVFYFRLFDIHMSAAINHTKVREYKTKQIYRLLHNSPPRAPGLQCATIHLPIPAFCFQTKGRKRRPNLAVVLLFILCSSTFC